MQAKVEKTKKNHVKLEGVNAGDVESARCRLRQLRPSVSSSNRSGNQQNAAS